MRKKERANNLKQNDAPFWCILLMITFFPTLAIIFSFLNKIIWKLDWSQSPFFSGLGIVLPVAGAIVCCVVSVLGIFISLQKEDYLDVPVKVIFSFRRKTRFSFTWIATVSFLLLCLASVGYLMTDAILCVVPLIISIVFCISSLFVEIPFLTLQDKAIVSIIKDHYVSSFEGKTKEVWNQSNSFNDLVFEIISCNDKDLKWLYERVKEKSNDEFNKFLLWELLSIQGKKAFELNKIESKNRLVVATDKMLGTVCDIIDGSFDVTSILGDNTSQYHHLMTWVLFSLLDNSVSKEKTEKKMSEMLKWGFVFSESKQAQIDLFFSVFSLIIINKIKDNDFSLANRVKTSLSVSYFTLQRSGVVPRIFLMISFIMYYLVEVERDFPVKSKESIVEFINDCGVTENVIRLSWKQLFNHFSSSFDVPLKEFLADFNKNYHYYQFYLETPTGHWVVLTEELAIDWYLANFFNSEQNHFDTDYEEMIQASEDQRRVSHLYELEKELFSNGERTFVPSDRFCKLASFYQDTDAKFSSFRIAENRTHSFEKYIQSLRIRDIEQKVIESSFQSNQKLIDYYQPKLIEQMRSIFGYSESIDLASEQNLYISFETWRVSDAINYDSFIVNAFIGSIEHEITRKAIVNRIRTIKGNSEFEKNIAELIKNEFEYVSSDVQFIRSDIKDSSIRSKFDERVKASKTIDNSCRFFYKPTIVLKDGFGFNCQLELRVFDLSPESVRKRVDECLQSNGKYIYEDAVFTREELTRIIQKTFAVFQVVFSYKVSTYEGGIVALDPYSFDETPDPTSSDQSEKETDEPETKE